MTKKSIAYDYRFNYFGGKKFKGKKIVGACVLIAVRAYKNGIEVKFTEEPVANGIYYSSIINVSVDRKQEYVVRKNIDIDNIFRTKYGWDKIETEVIGYTLDYEEVMPQDLEEKLKDEINGIMYCEPMEVTEEQFREFIRNNIDEFDIEDNINADGISVCYL